MLELPDGLYPFIDERFPLSELVMVEAPAELEALFKAQAATNGVEIMRDQPVELNCQSAEFPDATFLIYWPLGQPRIHMLVPKRFAQGARSELCAVHSVAAFHVSHSQSPGCQRKNALNRPHGFACEAQ